MAYKALNNIQAVNLDSLDASSATKEYPLGTVIEVNDTSKGGVSDWTTKLNCWKKTSMDIFKKHCITSGFIYQKLQRLPRFCYLVEKGFTWYPFLLKKKCLKV